MPKTEPLTTGAKFRSSKRHQDYVPALVHSGTGASSPKKMLLPKAMKLREADAVLEKHIPGLDMKKVETSVQFLSVQEKRLDKTSNADGESTFEEIDAKYMHLVDDLLHVFLRPADMEASLEQQQVMPDNVADIEEKKTEEYEKMKIEVQEAEARYMELKSTSEQGLSELQKKIDKLEARNKELQEEAEEAATMRKMFQGSEVREEAARMQCVVLQEQVRGLKSSLDTAQADAQKQIDALQEALTAARAETAEIARLREENEALTVAAAASQEALTAARAETAEIATLREENEDSTVAAAASQAVLTDVAADSEEAESVDTDEEWETIELPERPSS
mmetsp:Transcript_32239/g.71264  ORF Transcript_32239/g.71264 Transcript_32239/m.71264 type:complete len:336 (-) Transcript_32239:102-1109(-)